MAPTGRLLAATKFAVPVLPRRYVPRPRLHAALDAGASLPLTVVVGVPGAGKSVVLASWLRERSPLPSVWLSCDARDAVPVAFWHALCAALSHAWPDRWLDVVDLLAQAEPDFDDVAIAIVNDLADLGEPVVIVMDDFHFAAPAAPSLITLIERLPAGCRVVVSSRSDPQLAQHRLRAHGGLSEIRDAELRLTPVEVGGVMREFEVELTETETELVATRTEGWLAGVQMAAVSLRDQSDPDRFLTDLAKTPSAVMDFLGTEVLDTQPQEIHDFLLATSVLEVLDEETCSAVTERADTDALLGRVGDRNLFLIELEDGVYRYHHLFADLLRHRLHAVDPERELALHRRAAGFFAESGDPENAILQLLAADEDVEAFELLRTSLVGAFYRGDGSILPRLVAKFEGLASARQPTRMTDLAMALAASASAREAEPWIARAERHAPDLSPADRARLAVAHAVIGLQYGEALDIGRAYADYQEAGGLPDGEHFGYLPSMLARGRLWLGDLNGAREIYEQALSASDDPSAKEVAMASGLAWLACVEGHLTEAEQVAGQALDRADSLGLIGNPITAEAPCALGRVAFERGDLGAAKPLLEQSISIGEGVRPAFAAMSQLVLSRVWLAEGRLGEALDGIALARAFLRPDSTSPLLDLCRALEGRIALETSDLARAEGCAGGLAPGNRASILKCRIHIVRGEFDHALEALARCEPVTLRERLDVAVLAARIAHGRQSADADALLAAALEVAQVERFVVAVTDDMFELRPRITRLLRSKRIGDFEQAVLDRIEGDPPRVMRNDGISGPLSDRELTVLRYLASRLTYPEIARELFISTNTLKTHVQRIYRKLGVSSRMEAVAEARRLGLL